MIENPRYVRELMALEVNAYVVKSASAKHRVAAIRAAMLAPKSKTVVVGRWLVLRSFQAASLGTSVNKVFRTLTLRTDVKKIVRLVNVSVLAR